MSAPEQDQDDTGPAPEARWRRRAVAGALTPVALVGALLLVLGPVHDGPEPAVVAASATAAAVASLAEAAPPAPGEDQDGDGLDDALELAIARRHAPRYRFTAHDPSGPSSRQNRDEEFFPLSVERFLAALEAGRFEVALEDGARTTVELAAGGRREGFEGANVVGFPSRLVGDPLGSAPVYAHVYPADAPGEVFCEYWVFYGYDRAEARVLGLPVTLGDHRCDWEHTAYRVRLDPPRLLEGFYYGHAKCLLVAGDDLERVEGEHPVVYVSQGKHASYPVACTLPSTPVPTWLVQHHDVANGRGPTWDAWRGPIVRLGERGRPTAAVARWQAFLGRWGPDGIELAGLEIGASPTGPLVKRSWGRHGEGTPWRDVLRARGAVAAALQESP